MKTFIQKCADGEALLEEIDDYIDSWHEGDGEDLDIHEYLGMTEEQHVVRIFSEAALRVLGEKMKVKESM